MSDTLTYTKQIKNGVLKTSEMEIGASIVGELTDFIEGQYGMIPVLTVMGKPVKLFTSGNLKSLAERVAKGDFTLGDRVNITRINNYTTKNGYSSSSFDVTKVGTPSTKATVEVLPTAAAQVSAAQSVKDKIAALKAAAGAKA